MIFSESSLIDLYNSAIEAFPRTQMRQYATHTIKIAKLDWTPFVGVKTLFIKAIAQNEGKEYNPIILLKGVNYNGTEVDLIASDGLQYRFDKLSLENSDVLIRCNCPDFSWRFRYYNSVDKSLYGSKGKKYEAKGIGPPANPMELPGMCKHCMKTMNVLQQSGIFKE